LREILYRKNHFFLEEDARAELEGGRKRALSRSAFEK